MSEPAEAIPIKDAIHPYTADYWNICAHCVAKREDNYDVETIP